MRLVKFLTGHCTAGNSGVIAIERFWARPRNQGGAGWNGKGYNVIIDKDGAKWYLTDPTKKEGAYSQMPNELTYSTVTNGVLGFNQNNFNVAYIGGVDSKGKAKDTRTPEQKVSMGEVFIEALKFYKKHQDVSGIMILGHRDFSKDKNGNNVIESWERVKECPCFDVIPEYNWMMVNSVNRGKFELPNK